MNGSSLEVTDEPSSRLILTATITIPEDLELVVGSDPSDNKTGE